MPFKNFPYADFQDLNLDWIVRQLKVVDILLTKIEKVEKKIPDLFKMLQNYAPLVSPHFAGEPTTPDVDNADNSNKVANTKFVHDLVDGIVSGSDVFKCYYDVNSGTFDSTFIELLGAIQNEKVIICEIVCGNSFFYATANRCRYNYNDYPDENFIALDFITNQDSDEQWIGCLKIDMNDTATYYETVISLNGSPNNPLMDGNASAGLSTDWSRSDHRHPTDTTRVAVAQGVGNAGKFLVVGSNGNVTTVTMTEWQGGNY